jgi:hypothetical protein
MSTPFFTRSLPLLLASAALGCGSNVDTSSSGSGGSGATTTTTTTGAGGAGGGVTSTSVGGAGGAGGDVTSTSAGGAGGAGGGVTSTSVGGAGGGTTTTTTTGETICGGKKGTPCASDEYCDYPDDSCGYADGTGVCKKRPQGCPDNYQPTCACDGTVYSGSCDAAAVGLDVNANGTCTPPSKELFPCLSGFCATKSQYCEVSVSDVFGEPSTFVCKDLPADCGGVPTCACLAGEPCADLFCDEQPNGVRVTCPGG